MGMVFLVMNRRYPLIGTGKLFPALHDHSLVVLW
jgi:hypothetical protein